LITLLEIIAFSIPRNIVPDARGDQAVIVFSVGENKYEQMSNIRRWRHIEVYELNSIGI